VSLEGDVKDILGAEEVNDSDLDRSSGQDPRLDKYRVISRTYDKQGNPLRVYDKNGFPLIYAGGRIYEFCRFTIEKTGNVIEIKFYQV
jgi:hypothetical protein